MNNTTQKSSTARKVLGKIKNDQIKMRSKTYFVLKSVLTIFSVFLVAFFILYLTSFILFALRASGAWYLHGFGFYGLRASFILLPWLLIIIATVLLVVLEILVKHFSFAYHRPILYSILGIIIFTISGSFVIDKAQFHTCLFQKAQEGRLPVMGNFYRNLGIEKNRNVCRGIVLKTINNNFQIKTPRGKVLNVSITSETQFSNGADIKKDDIIIVLGKRNNGEVQAIGVRKIDDELNSFPRMK
ncbi:MAG: hypothetical protein KAQ87_03830 [Candidatus Pacebacteria bacterium]|nr:hypothetical protein [Candidatus Paceibacterota bacterium]